MFGLGLGWPGPGSIQPMGARPMESYGLGLARGTGPLHDGPAVPMAARGPHQPLPPLPSLFYAFLTLWNIFESPPIGSATVHPAYR